MKFVSQAIAVCLMLATSTQIGLEILKNAREECRCASHACCHLTGGKGAHGCRRDAGGAPGCRSQPAGAPANGLPAGTLASASASRWAELPGGGLSIDQPEASGAVVGAPTRPHGLRSRPPTPPPRLV